MNNNNGLDAASVNRSLSSLHETEGGEGLMDDSSNENLYEERMAGDRHRSHQKQPQHGKANDHSLATSAIRMGSSPQQQPHQTGGSQRRMRGSLLQQSREGVAHEATPGEDDDHGTKKQKTDTTGVELNLT